MHLKGKQWNEALGNFMHQTGDECDLSWCLCKSVCCLDQLFGFKEALEMSHLPDAGDDEDDGLSDGPPENSLVCALAGHAEAFLAVLRTESLL